MSVRARACSRDGEERGDGGRAGEGWGWGLLQTRRLVRRSYTVVCSASEAVTRFEDLQRCAVSIEPVSYTHLTLPTMAVV